MLNMFGYGESSHRLSSHRLLWTVCMILLPVATLSLQAQEPILVVATHGEGDPGVVTADGRAESVLTLAVSRALLVSLDEGDLRAELVRSSEEHSNWSPRSRIAPSSFPTLFLHAAGYQDLRRRGGRIFYCGNDPTSRDLGESILRSFAGLEVHYSLVEASGLPEKEVCNGLGPAVSIEVGTLTNFEEAGVLWRPSFQKAIAQKITSAVQDFYASVVT